MYKIWLESASDKYEYESLIQGFLKPEDYELFLSDRKNIMSIKYGGTQDFIHIRGENKNQIKQEIYKKLSKLTGIEPDWGIHTGVRPVKMTGELFRKYDFDRDKVIDRLRNFYMISSQKTDLLCEIFDLQEQVLGKTAKNNVSLYVGIPFCPTRCLYCSFTSNQASDEKIQQYLRALEEEIRYTGVKMKEYGLKPESIYVGGGTPTSLSAFQMEALLELILDTYDLSDLREFTVEGGRPDTITIEKLEAIRAAGVNRISINPQTMKDKTLETIGRSHNTKQVYEAFEMAHKVGIPSINADVIAGLPEEDVADFDNTLTQLVDVLRADNITVHTLAIKRASRLIDIDSNFHYKQAEVVRKMLELGKEKLHESGYRPYYLYRQKHMAGGLENVGYARLGTEGVYNIRIMDEHQSIVALGAGGISKAYYPAEDRLERVPNVSNYEIYISRLQEMLARKEEKLFRSECYV